jgi:putative FmdB family regulatory protein
MIRAASGIAATHPASTRCLDAKRGYAFGITTTFPTMPIYVFRCDACDHEFERLQKLSEPDPVVCPECGKRNTVRRQVTAPVFRLAGSGWYETDFKSDKEKKRNLAGSEAPAGGEKKAPAKEEGAGKPPAPAEKAPSATASPAKPKPADKPAGRPATDDPR